MARRFLGAGWGVSTGQGREEAGARDVEAQADEIDPAGWKRSVVGSWPLFEQGAKGRPVDVFSRAAGVTAAVVGVRV